MRKRSEREGKCERQRKEGWRKERKSGRAKIGSGEWRQKESDTRTTCEEGEKERGERKTVKGNGRWQWQWWVVMAMVITRGSDSGVEMVAARAKIKREEIKAGWK
jgi:hypothetical protein